MKKTKHPLTIKTKVKFQISNEIEKGIAVIIGRDKDPDDGHWSYKLDVIEGNRADRHRENGDPNGELWVNDFEIISVVKRGKKHRWKIGRKKNSK